LALKTSRTQDRMWIKDQTVFDIHKKSAHCRLSRDQQIRSNRPRKPGESQDQLVLGDSDWQRARPSYQDDQGGRTHPQGTSTIHESRWRKLSTQSRIRPLSWHVKFKFSSCQEPEDLVPASSSDEGLWQRPKRQQK